MSLQGTNGCISTRSPLEVGPTSAGEKTPPAISSFIPIGNGMAKLGNLIFKSGEILLTRKIEKAIDGRPEEKYSVSEHLETLNDMYPETREYNPVEMKKKIDNFKKLADKKAKKAPQGKKDGNPYPRQSLEDDMKKEEFVKLLKHADMMSLEPVPEQYVRHGAQTRYKGNTETVDVDLLEEEESCVNCGGESLDLVMVAEVGKVCSPCMEAQKEGNPTIRDNASMQEESCVNCGDESLDLLMVAEVGKVCSPCMEAQKEGNPTIRDNASMQEPIIRDKASLQEEQANIVLNKELLEMDDSPFNIRREAKINSGASSSRRNFGDDTDSNTDEEIRIALLGQLQRSKKREELEMEKARLDVLIRIKEYEKMGGKRDDAI